MTLKRPAWFNELNWTEVEDAIKEADRIAIIPVGNLEPWGDLPVGSDNYQMMGHVRKVIELAKEDDEIEQIVVMPPIYYGCGSYWDHFPGSAPIPYEVMKGFYKAVCEALIRQGVTKIVWISGHSGDVPVIVDVGRELKDKYGTLSALERMWVMEHENRGNKGGIVGGEITRVEDLQRGHGGRHCTPIPEILATSPELIERFKSKLKDVPRPKEIYFWGTEGFSNPAWEDGLAAIRTELEGFKTPEGKPSHFFIIGHWEDVYPYAAVGDARVCVEKEGIEEGVKAIDFAGRHTIALIKEMMKIKVPANGHPVYKAEDLPKSNVRKIQDKE